MLIRRSPFLRLMPLSSFHGWCLRLAADAALQLVSRPLPDLRFAPVVHIRERRASSAPAFRMVSRSGMPQCVVVPSVRPVVRLRALRADARARGGTGRPSGRPLMVTGPRGTAPASVRR